MSFRQIFTRFASGVPPQVAPLEQLNSISRKSFSPMDPVNPLWVNLASTAAFLIPGGLLSSGGIRICLSLSNDEMFVNPRVFR